MPEVDNQQLSATENLIVDLLYIVQKTYDGWEEYKGLNVDQIDKGVKALKVVFTRHGVKVE